MNTQAQDLAIAQAAVNRHFEIWNDDAGETRAGKFAAAYTADIFVADYAHIAAGYADVNEFIENLRAKNKGFFFTPDPVAWNNGIGRVTWGYGPAEAPGLIRGEDIFTMKDGRIASLRVFIDRK